MLMPLIIVAVATGLPSTSQAAGSASPALSAPRNLNEINLKNSTDRTIFKVFAWPSDLNQRTFNLLQLPILSHHEDKITIDNQYDDCEITFQIDINDPAKAKNRRYKKNPYIIYSQDICKYSTDVEIGQPAFLK